MAGLHESASASWSPEVCELEERHAAIAEDGPTQAVLEALVVDGRAPEMHTHSISEDIACGTERLQAKARALQAQGQDYAAFSVQCALAYSSIVAFGPDDTEALQDVLSVVDSLQQQEAPLHLHVYYEWLLPRAVQHWGIGGPRTRQLVQRAAMLLTLLTDARQHTALSNTVTELAQQMPGGLGWGSTVVAPVPDEEAYNRHVFMLSQAHRLVREGHYRVAKDMYKRCVAYFDTLGLHWLAVARKHSCASLMMECILNLDGPKAAEHYILAAKRQAQRELGPTHPTTLDIAWSCALALDRSGRPEAALSVVNRVLSIRLETLGPRNNRTLRCQVRAWVAYSCMH